MGQILSITCDNAANNDVMVRELSKLLSEYEGEFGHTRCFLHVINLVAQSILRQFDVKELSEDEIETLTDDTAKKLAKLAVGLEDEEAATQMEGIDLEELDDEGEDNDEADWVDEMESMSEEEHLEFQSEIEPIKTVLMKVSELAD